MESSSDPFIHDLTVDETLIRKNPNPVLQYFGSNHCGASLEIFSASEKI